MVTWIIEQNVFNEVCFEKMVSFLKERSIAHHLVKIIPFVHEIEGKIPTVSGPVVVYGSIGSQKLSQKMNWTPGVFSGKFAESDYVEILGKLCVNPDVKIIPLSKVVEQIDMDEFFIKPNTDTKEFAGQILEKKEFEVWYNKMVSIGYLDNNDFDVVVAPLVEIKKENRLVVVDGQVVAGSMYRLNDRTNQAEIDYLSFQSFVTDVEKIFKPSDVYVMDVGLTEDGWKIIEYNTFNSAGFYMCNVTSIMESINSYIEKA